MDRVCQCPKEGHLDRWGNGWMDGWRCECRNSSAVDLSVCLSLREMNIQTLPSQGEREKDGFGFLWQGYFVLSYASRAG